MKRNFELIQNNEVDSILSMQDEGVRKLLASRERLLAINAIFDAALTGESGRHIAEDISRQSGDVGEQFTPCFRNEESSSEH